MFYSNNIKFIALPCNNVFCWFLRLPLVSSFVGCLTPLRGDESTNPEMGTLIAAGIAAIAIGLTQLAAGGVSYQPVKVNLRERSILGQAWFIILVLGFTLIALDVYLTTMHP